ncbi:restriction endonuclease subunit S [Streptomyces sp. NPDC002138]|uniref:restriction endonuclease subunit S n=1 Tax=Streptomyces sp. NPDC002138 TaxID=3154410 RepID=UPI003328DBF2
MMSYAEYRDSGVPWVGRIPKGWDTVPLMSVLHESRVKNVGLTENNLLSLSFGRIVRKDIDAVGGLLPESFETYQIVEPNHLVFRFTDLQNDQRSLRSARVTERGIITSAYVSMRPTGIDARYAEHLMRSYDVTKVFYGLGGGVRQSLKFSNVARLPVILPPVEEQRAIADYLDRETACIDTLIEEQRRLIELLDERRDGVIAEAVTKGVRPGAALVDSGVEWLGDIPEGWSVKALRRCGTLLTGSTPPTDNRGNFAEEANERPWVRPQDLSARTRASAWLTAEGWAASRPVPAGSVLVGCIAYSLGSVGHLPVAATTNQQITSVVPAEEGRYLYYVMRAAKSELWAASQMNRVPILNNQRLGAIRVPVPPVDEQRLIAAYLDEQTEKIERTRAEAERFIELARERRSALITAAVTGQIDVRGVA